MSEPVTLSFAEYFAYVTGTISAIAAGAGLFYVGKTFRKQLRSEEIRLTESVFKDIRTLQQDLMSIPNNDKLALRNWDEQFFNTVEWFCFLINQNEIKDPEIIKFFTPSLLKYHKMFLKNMPNETLEDKELYKEFKSLIQKIQPTS